MNVDKGNIKMELDKRKPQKVIISHDVDHLFAKDHWFRDLIYPKMWVRNTLELLKKQITWKEWWLRNSSCFRRNRHNLDALMDFDEKHGVKSTFFFGMNQGLGMSYRPEEARPVILNIYERGFAVGVHGIEYQNSEGIKREYETFKKVTGLEPCGIRMHYVRFDDQTFNRLNDAGYVFDTTEFDKLNCGTRKAPYIVGKMWEFPLAIMDAYLPQQFEASKKATLELLDKCKELEYITVLFHDYQFCNSYQDMKKWYEWLIDFFYDSTEYMFISYEEAIQHLSSS